MPACWHSTMRTCVRGTNAARLARDPRALRRGKRIRGMPRPLWIHARRLEQSHLDRTSSRPANMQRHYDAGHPPGACAKHFGFSSATWCKAVKRGELRLRPGRRSLLAVVLQSGARGTVKRHLLEAGILTNRCAWCGISEWRGRPISIQIDHINGVRDDNRVENLRMLCPNCHSQTETFAARNSRRGTTGPGSSNGRTAASEVAYRGSSP